MIELFALAIAVSLGINLALLIMKIIVEVLNEEGDETNKANVTTILDDDGTEIEPFAYRIGDDGELTE